MSHFSKLFNLEGVVGTPELRSQLVRVHTAETPLQLAPEVGSLVGDHALYFVESALTAGGICVCVWGNVLQYQLASQHLVSE